MEAIVKFLSTSVLEAIFELRSADKNSGNGPEKGLGLRRLR